MTKAPTKHPTKRVNMTMRESDWDAAEKLRVAMGHRSCSAVIRQLLREEAKRRGID